MEDSGSFWSGTSGLVLSEPNKKSFPSAFQEKSKLAYYSSIRDSIEINSSFYKIPRPDTYQKWAESVADPFRFSVKLWKGFTHPKDFLSWDPRDLKKFFIALDKLGDKKGCLLVQFPATKKRDLPGFEKFMELIRMQDPETSWRIAVEFRHAAWYQPEVYSVLDRFQASLVLHDMPDSIPMQTNSAARFIYYRFHGENGDYRGRYQPVFLLKKASEIRNWLDEGKEVFAYFNNTRGASEAVDNLSTLNQMVNDLIIG
jgi:uncharacterized protein YecE (DUF72 family)